VADAILLISVLSDFHIESQFDSIISATRLHSHPLITAVKNKLYTTLVFTYLLTSRWLEWECGAATAGEATTLGRTRLCRGQYMGLWCKRVWAFTPAFSC